MESANLSLTDLSDIVLPPSISFWPLGQGAYLFCLAILISIGLLTYLYLTRKRANAYRREGLRLLASAETVHDVSVVLKRVALGVFARERVASLYGDPWLRFLGETCSGCKVQGLCGTPDLLADDELRTAAGFWIRHHTVTQEKPRG
jgi:hypothetical protein